MNNLNEYKLKVLTPLHVGNDDNLQSISYHHFVDEDFVYIYDIKEICEKIDNIEDVFNIKGKNLFLGQFLDLKKIKELTPLRKLLVRLDEEIKGQELNLFVTEDNELYLPGSSLKGAIIHALEYKYGSNPNFNNSLGISDLYFDEVVSQIERGLRITSSPKKGSSKQKQDNYKEWIVIGKTKKVHTIPRTDIEEDILQAIYEFTKDYLEYQKTYYDYLFDVFDFENHDLAEIAKNVSSFIDGYMNKNTPETPILILGSNTHRFSKTNELKTKKTYIKTSGKNSAHPLSRLLIIDENGYYTLPGLLWFQKQ